MKKILSKLRKFGASLVAIALLAGQLPIVEAAALTIGSDTLANPTAGATSAHSIAFSTTSNLITGNTIELNFPNFTFAIENTSDIIVPVGPTTTTTYSNTDKKITLTLTENFSAGAIEIAIASDGITNPATEGQYSVHISTKNSNNSVLDNGLATAEIANNIQVLVNVIPVVLNITSSVDDDSYFSGEIIPIQIEFTGNVFVTGTPSLALNNEGTASYVSGSGTSTLIFEYEIQAGQELTVGEYLDYESTTALTIEDGEAISLASGKPANLTLPIPSSDNSLSGNKNIEVIEDGQSSILSVTSPIALFFEIMDDNGVTNTPIPLLQFEAKIESGKVALSCDGINWGDWITYPDSGKLNFDSAEDFNILKCSDEEGLKTILIKFSNSFGYESLILTDSTIYKNPNQQVTETPINDSGSSEVIEKTVDLKSAIEEIKNVEPNESNDENIIEVGYVDPDYNTWKSFRDIEIDENGNATVETEAENEIEVRIIPAKKLENQTSEITTSSPVLPKTGGTIPSDTELTSKTNSATVKISASTNVTVGGGGGGGEKYDYVIYAPEVIENPPLCNKGIAEIDEAIFIGSSSGSIEFDQPVLLTLPIEDKNNPQIYYFSEKGKEWVKTIDVKGGKDGGEINPDGKTISVWVDHMTLFAVVGIRKVQLVGISKVAIGGDNGERAKFASGEWFSPADIGNDDLVSLAWSGVGEKFYYTLDKNPAATSLRKITNDTKFTNDFFVDGIRLSEGESYFHVRAEGADGERDGETVFVINYDKTAPSLTKINTETEKIELHFSEKVASNDTISIYFSDGRELEIPTLTTPTDILEISFEGEIPEIMAIVGLLVDRAGLILINPEPNISETADNQIRNSHVEILYPGRISNGKYFTQKAFVNVQPTATGAVKMRLAGGEWESFKEKEFRIKISNFGTEKIIFEFESASGQTKSAGVVITRLPSDMSEFDKVDAAQNLSLEKLSEKIATKLKKLIVWGISVKNEETLALANPGILPSEEIPDEETISNLNDALDITREIRELANHDKPSAKKIRKLASELSMKNFSLDDFLAVSEISNLFSKISNSEAEQLIEFLNLNSVAPQKNGDHFTASKLSLGMRDSDNDGLSDALELDLGSSPFLADSDNDNNIDSSEFLQFGTDPMEENLSTATGFTNLEKKITSPRPFLTGVAPANSKISVIALNSDQSEIEIGETTSDPQGRFNLWAEKSLPSDFYELQIHKSGKILATGNIEIDLDFILLPPQIFIGTSNIFEKKQPAFYGNTFYDSRIIAFFDNSPSAIIVDNSLGDFVIRPPAALANGKHKLVIFTELSDGTRSLVRVIEFETTESSAKSAAPIKNIDFEKIVFGGGALLLFGILGIWIFRRRNQSSP